MKEKILLLTPEGNSVALFNTIRCGLFVVTTFLFFNGTNCTFRMFEFAAFVAFIDVFALTTDCPDVLSI